MASAVPFKICRCKDPNTGKALSRRYPQLRRAYGSWSRDHGQWAYQLELPVTADGRRRQLRPSTGFTDRQDAQSEIDQALELLSVAGRHKQRLTELGDLIQSCRRSTGILPDVETVRQRLRADSPLADVPSVATYLTEWVDNVDVDENTRRTYAGHITTHLIPHLGDVVLDRLRPQHVYVLIRKIKERNDELAGKRNDPDAAVRRSVAGRRATGPATRSRIRATLRAAFNDALRQGIITGVPNPAALVKTSNPRPRPVVWGT